MATLLSPRLETGLVLRCGNPYRRMVGVGGVGTGTFFLLEGNRALTRGESRPAALLDARDYCKLHVMSHYVSVLTGGKTGGFHVLPIAHVGDDEAGRRLRQEILNAGMDASAVKTIEGRPTLFSVCFLYEDGSGGNITSNNSAAAAMAAHDLDAYEPMLAPHTIAAAMPEAPLAVRDDLLQRATRHGAFRVASFTSAEVSQAREMEMFSRIDLLALNDEEASELAGIPFDVGKPHAALDRCAQFLCSRQPAIRIVVSAGQRGAFAFSGERWHYHPAPAVRAVSTAGAGDALLAGIVSALAAGIPFHCDSARGAVDFGVLLAAFSVTSPHTIHPEANLASLLAFAQSLNIDCSALAPYVASPACATPAARIEQKLHEANRRS